MRRVGLSVAAVVAAVGLMAGCSGSEDTSDAGKDGAAVEASAGGGEGKPEDAAEGDDASGDVKITSSGVKDHEVWGPDAYVVEYTITNHGKGAADYFAQFEFLDKDGDVLGSTGVTADKLGAGKTKTGDAAPLDVEIENGKIADIQDVRVSQVDRT